VGSRQGGARRGGGGEGEMGGPPRGEVGGKSTLMSSGAAGYQN